METKKILKKILLIIMAISTVVAFSINVLNIDSLAQNLIKGSSPSDIEVFIKSNGPFKFCTFALLIQGLFFYFLYQKYYFQKKETHYTTTILAILFSLFMIVGYSYNVTDSWNLIFGNTKLFLLSIIMFVGYFIFFNASINLLYEFIKTKSKEESVTKNKIFNFIFNEHPFISTFIILFVCYLPYIIAFYPGILSPDPSNQIKQFYGIPTKYNDYSVMLDENVTITNHHPVLHTVILGGLTYFGKTIGSENFGVFIYSILQTLFLITLLSYTISYMKKLNTPIWFRIVSLLIYMFVPIYPLYGMSTLKDVIFAILVIFYIIKLFELIRCANNKINIKEIITVIILMLFITLFRNNGIYLVLMSFPFLLIIDKQNRFKLLITLLIPIMSYYGFEKVLLPSLKITPGSVREVLSIPFQQTARYVKYYPDDISEEDKNAIDKILTYDTLAKRYDPEKSDPVKNKYNKYATKDDLKNYFKAWIHGLVKHPNVYIEATLNNTYGYFYPDAKRWYVYYSYDTRLSEDGIDYHYNNLDGLRNTLSNYAVAFPYIPILGSIVSIGFCTWLCMLMWAFIMREKKYKYLIYLMPVVSLILVCVASPVNTYFRYTLGYTFAIPILIAIYLWILYNKEERK